ncbi:hypothetical protein [Acinetobacter sp. BSP-28]|uniref:hypothetical protein n=1 Tax=Acinetobacter sp. BSP-28 TaxID=3344661 RepID=UPI00376F7BCE
MDIQKEREAFEQWYLEHHRITHMPSIYCPADALYGGAYTNTLWTGWQAAKAQAVPEWIEYEKQSPRIDGRYQIFINGEQLAADWESPYGFSSAEDGTAFIQELITHWSVLNNDPVIEAQEQKG